jgi:V/A-type H+-transporting ATPase subunit C
MSIDLHYFMKILKLKDKILSGGDRKSITNTFGIEIDMMNILMIYRCKKLFKFPKELTFKYVIPYWYRLTREQLVSLSGCHGVDEFKEQVAKTGYADIFKADEEHLWEISSLNWIYHVFKRHLRQDMFSLGTMMAYLHLKEIDIRNIITLIEGVRYGLGKEEIRGYLAGVNVR